MIIHNDFSIVDKVEAAKRETHSAGARRLADYLLANPAALSGEVARNCALLNISDAANKIRPAPERYGLTIIASKPVPLIKNRFGEVSQSHEWRLVRLR